MPIQYSITGVHSAGESLLNKISSQVISDRSLMMGKESEIAEWYRGKAVFVTGATGFMGKVLVEKLLRSCPGVTKIYILVRERKNVRPHDRLEKMMSCAAFDKVRGELEQRKECLVPIPGDVGLPGLGIFDEHRLLLQDTVSVVFHLAATVRFNEPLRIAVAMNVEGTRALIELCLGMTRLSAVVHVSTAYTNCNRPMIEERVYPPPADPEKVMHCVAGMDDEILELVTPRLIGSHPNTYTFTKALAENVVEGYSTELPIVVVRPSIVSASWREPCPGWVDSFNGSAGLVVGAGKGQLNTVFANSRLIADVVPVDVSVNLTIAAGWEIGSREGKRSGQRVLVYNCVSRPFKPITWGEYCRVIDDCVKKYPLGEFLRIPGIKPTSSSVKFASIYYLLHALPATLLDLGVWLTGGTPKFRGYQRKLKMTNSLVNFFTTHEFEFRANNVEGLWRRLNPADQAIFNFDMRQINWEECLTAYVLGIRRYLLKEKDDTIDKFRQRVVTLSRLKRILQIGVLSVVAFISYYAL